MRDEKLCERVRGAIFRIRQSCKNILCDELIVQTESGYRINPELNIITDLDQFDALCDRIQQAPTDFRKADYLKQAIALYKSGLFGSSGNESWIIDIVHHYDMRYMKLTNELLKILSEVADYSGVQQYAEKSLKIIPWNAEAYYWLIQALYCSNASEMANYQVKRAKENLTEEDYKMLTDHFRLLKRPACVTTFDESMAL